MKNKSGKILFHGSKVGGLNILTPKPHGAVGGESVVFATTDRRFALAMIHGTGEQLAFDYEINTTTGDARVYLDEIEKGALKLLEQPGYLYRVPSTDFVHDERLIPQEVISRKNVPVLDVEYFPNVLDELKKEHITIVCYDDVPASMAARDHEDTKMHDENRFSSI